ncbi:hypothetical protein ACW9YV_06730 [Paraburkholderia strydomiana]|jgi:hypothetical protein
MDQWIDTSHCDGVQLIAEQSFQVMSWATAQYTESRSDCPGAPRVSRHGSLRAGRREKKNGVVPGQDDAVKTSHARGGYLTSAQKVTAQKFILKMKELRL